MFYQNTNTIELIYFDIYYIKYICIQIKMKYEIK